MGLDVGNKTKSSLVDRARALDPADLDKISDAVEEAAPKLSLDAAGQARAYRLLLGMANSNPDAYSLVLKRLKDMAKQYVDLTHSALRADMKDAEFVRSVAYHAGAWQALTMMVNLLSPVELKKSLDVLEQGMHTMGGGR